MVDLVERLESCSNIDDSCRLMNALARGSSAYTDIYRATELESRLDLLENERTKKQTSRYGAAAA